MARGGMIRARHDSMLVLVPRLLAKFCSRGVLNQMDEDLVNLLENKSVLVRPNNDIGKDDLEDQFLCAEVDDEDLPWDITENDW